MARARAATRHVALTPVQAATATRLLHADDHAGESRLRVLVEYAPKGGHRLPEAVVHILVTLITRTPYRSKARDLDLMAALVKIATFDYDLHHGFDPARAMSETSLAQWKRQDLARRGITPRSQGDYCSLVRFVAKHNGFAQHLTDRASAPRGLAAAPAAVTAWRSVEDRCRTLKEPWATEVMMVADLTFGAGLRGYELARARRDDLLLGSAGEGVLRVANHRGEVREVPLGPAVTQRILRAQRSQGQFLVRPNNSRHNVINVLLDKADRWKPGTKFNITAARNRYIVTLMSEPLPFAVVCYLADLAPGGHTAQDLAKFAPCPPPRTIQELVRETWR